MWTSWSVREIRGWTPATPLPRSPGFVRGVINLRGAVLPIVDLASRLGFAATEPTQRHVIIVAQIGKQIVGLLVDAVSDILTVGDEMVQAPPDVASEMVRNFVQGLLAMDGRMISLISLDRVLPKQEDRGCMTASIVSRPSRAGLVDGEFPLTIEDFRCLAAMLHADAGISLPESKATLLYSRLARRLRALGADGFPPILRAARRSGGTRRTRTQCSPR